MQVSALVGCEAAVFVGCCPELVGVCLGVHGLELFFQELVGARARGDQGLGVGSGSVCLLRSEDLSELVFLVSIWKYRLDESEHAFSSKSLATSSFEMPDEVSSSLLARGSSSSANTAYRDALKPPTGFLAGAGV